MVLNLNSMLVTCDKPLIHGWSDQVSLISMKLGCWQGVNHNPPKWVVDIKDNMIHPMTFVWCTLNFSPDSATWQMFKQIQQSWLTCHCIAFTSSHHLHSYHLTHVYPFQGGLNLLLDSSRGFLLTLFIKCETGIKGVEYLLDLINMALNLHIHCHILHKRYRCSVLILFGVPLAG